MSEVSNIGIHSDGIGFSQYDLVLTGDINNLNIGSSSLLVLTNDTGGNVVISGFDASEMIEGMSHAIWIFNSGLDAVTLPHNSLNSAQGNRLFLAANVDKVLSQNTGSRFVHLKTDTRTGWQEF